MPSSLMLIICKDKCICYILYSHVAFNPRSCALLCYMYTNLVPSPYFHSNFCSGKIGKTEWKYIGTGYEATFTPAFGCNLCSSQS